MYQILPPQHDGHRRHQLQHELHQRPSPHKVKGLSKVTVRHCVCTAWGVGGGGGGEGGILT